MNLPSFKGEISRENEITYLLVPSSGFKNEIAIEPDSHSRKAVRARVWGKPGYCKHSSF